MRKLIASSLLGLGLVFGSVIAPVSTSAQIITVEDKARPSSKTTCPASDPIKGNINRKGERIYHVPGSKYYNRTHPEVCFRSEREARSNGFRAPYR